ncbi:MAG TPA: tRNA epoxyqueuosine(34) reductase QueG [Terracidiphilus sp.]|jgi:epoxyqueuosine reductase
MPVFDLSPDELSSLAKANGFDLAGIATLEEQGSEDSEDYLERWIAAGHAGEMDYLKRRNEQGALLRSQMQAAIPWARSVIVCAANYNAPGPLSIDAAPPTAGWIARYAWAGQPDSDSGELRPSDYHETLLNRLRALEATLHHRIGQAFESRSYVDTGPFIERDLARQAGIGWTARNTCTLNQQLGSWLFLCCIVTSLDVADASRATPAIDRCGTCRRCIEACPTDALVAPYQMDASRCIAYLTIEKRGSIAEELRAPIGRQVFGCDICQEVCPWNAKANRSRAAASSVLTRPELINPALAWLAELTVQEFNRQFRNSPIKRTKRSGLLRNVAIAMGNSGEPEFLPQLETWAESESDDPVLAEAAGWAIERLRTS